MAKQVSAVKKVMINSLNKDFTPFPVNRKLCSKWTETLPYGGGRIIYTSFMYQLSGLFKSYEKHLSAFTKTGGSSKVASIGKYIFKPKKEDLQRSYRILNNISSLLERSGIKHGYLYDDEPYSGGLLLEMGMLDEFQEYGKKVLSIFRDKGVREIITVDPHTTNAMRRLVEMTDTDLKVTNYLDLVKPGSGKGDYVLHDPCLYTRYNNLGDTMRDLLSGSGIVLHEDRMVTSKDYGTCCGGPLGPVNVELSEKIAKNRAKKLLSVSDKIIVACPLCYQNLSPYVGNISDLSEVVL